jgi:hypothetical protein
MDELPKLYSIIKRDMWLSGKRYIKKRSKVQLCGDQQATKVMLARETCCGIRRRPRRWYSLEYYSSHQLEQMWKVVRAVS